MKKQFRSLFLVFIALIAFGKANAAATKVVYCQLSNGTIRVFIEHDHGNLNSSDITVNLLNIGTFVTKNIKADGFINNTAESSLSSCSTSIAVVKNCSGSTHSQDWVYFDFDGSDCNQTVSIIINSGLSFLSEDCSNLFPFNITVDFPDTKNPTITCGGTLTKSATSGLCNAVLKVTSPTVTDNCSELILGNALNFDGKNDIALIDATSSINTAAQQKRTVEVYFRVNDKSIKNQKQVVWEEGGTFNGINIYVYDNKLYYGIYSEDNNWSGTWVSTSAIKSGQWHNAVLVYDGTISTGRLKAYLDGNLADSVNGSTSLLGAVLHTHSGNNAVGGMYEDGKFHDGDVTITKGHYFGGDIDEIRLWTIARTASELRSTNTVKLNGNESGLVVYYDFDQGTACGNNSTQTTLYDRTSTSLDADISSFALNNGCTSNFTNGSPALKSPLTLTNDYTGTSDASGTYPVGTTTITWTAEDESGNKKTCTQKIIVTENVKPVITCVGDQTKNSASNLCAYKVSGTEFNPVSFSDSCSTPTISNNFNHTATLANAEFPVGTTNVVWTVTDGSDNTNTCSFNVVVKDKTKPVIQCSSDVQADNNAGLCGAVLKITSPGVTDNCSQLILGNALNFDGTNDIALIDASSSINTANQQKRTVEVYFRVNDKSINSRKQVIWEEGGSDNGLNIYVYDNQLYYGIYSESDNWNGTWVSTSNINSGQWHNAVLVYDGTISSGRLKAYLDGKLVDSADASSTLGTSLKKHPAANAVGALQSRGKFHDGAVSLSLGHYFGGDIDEIRLWTIARSKTDLELTNTVKLNGNESGLIAYYDFDQGSACGNNSTQTTLYDRTSTGLDADLSSFALNSGCTSNFTDGSPALKSPLSLTNNYTGTSDASGTYPVGTTNVVWTAKDEYGNTSTCTQKVIVKDVEKPVITCIGDQTKNSASNLCAYKGSGTEFNPVLISDNCSAPSISNSFNHTSTLANAEFPVGSTNVVWTVTDGSNNTNTCSFNVIVEDKTKPVIQCSSDVQANNNSGLCGAVLKITSPGVTDNCSQLILGNALNFDGTNDIALIDATSSINTADQQKRTVEVYFRVNDKSIKTQKQVIWEEGGVDNGLNIYVYDNKLYYGIYSESKGWSGKWLSTSAINSGQWHNAVLVYDGTISSKCLKAYLDGNLVDSADASSTLGTSLNKHPGANAVGALQNKGKFHDGDVNLSLGHYFGGDIDEIRLWTIARTASELQSTNTVKLDGNESGLAVYYDFDQGTACGNNSTQTTLYDRTSTGLDADLSSFALNSGCTSNFTNGSPALKSPLSLTNNYTGTSDASGTYPVGTTNVVWTAKDEYGNTSTCTQKVIVKDVEKPVITCVGDQTKNSASNLCAYKVSGTEFNPVSFSDNCSTTTISNSFNHTATLANAEFPVGTTNVVWTVTDGSDNTNTCSFNVVVKDKTKPVIQCSSDVQADNNAGLCGAVLKITSPGVTDNCSQLILGNALNFDGTNDIALIDASSSINTANQQKRTVEVYFRVNDKSINSRKQVIWEEGGSDNGLNIYVYDNQLYYGIYSESDNWNGTWVSTSNINSGQWHNAVLVYDGTISSGRLKAYLDGKLVDSADASSTLGTSLKKHPAANAVGALQSRGKFHDGAVSLSLGHYFGGDIDEIRLWTIARSKTDLELTNTVKLNGNESGLIAYYDFDQGSACGNNSTQTTLYDRTSTGLDADLSSFALNSGCTSNFTDGSPALKSPLSLTNNYTGTSDASGTYPVGTTNVVWTAKDEYGNTSTCTQKVIVKDVEKPVITCASDQSQTADAGVCKAAVTVTAPATSDNCAVASVTNDYNNTSDASGTYPVGSTTVTWTVTDINGNKNTCSQIIKVTDDEKPKITCASDQSQTADAGVCKAAVTVTAPATSDNCAVVSVTNDYNNTSDASGTYPVGSTTVTWTVTDINGNKNTCSQIIKVTDDEKPKITCASDQSQTADAGVCKAAVTVTAPATSDNCAVASVTNDYNNTSDASGTYPVGSTTVTWTVTDIHGNKNTCSQIIKVTDDEKPKITCAADQSQTADAGVCKAAVTVTAPATSDNCAVASVTNDYNNTSDASGTYPVGSTTVTWTVTDIHGNKNTCSQIIKVTDDEKPKITCASDQSQTADAGVCKAAVTVTAPATSDNCSVASVTNDYNNTSDASGTYPVGSTTVTWTVTDIHGNKNTCSQIIKVTDDEKPKITCAADQSQTADAGVCKAAVTVTAPATSDNCAVASVTNDYNNTSDASGTYPVGSTTVTWTVTDIHGNKNTCSQIIKVTDDEKPKITCASDLSQTADAGVCKAAVTVTAPATSDNCAVASITNDYNNTSDASGTYPVGSTTVTWTVTDIHGNKNTCSQIIKVTDDEKPKITCASDQSQTADAGVCKAAVTVTAPATSDNCAVASVTNDYNNTSDASGTYPVGSTTVTWTVTDINGNKNTCSQIIKVTDDEKPKITCASDQSQTADAGVCKAAVTVTAPATSDNCAVVSVTNDYNNTSDASGTYPVGSTTVTWTVTDINGNKNTCSQIIKVTDDEKPKITCASDQSQTADAGVCKAAVTVTAPATSDNCAVASVTNDYNNTSDASGTYPVGSTTVTWTVTDIHGNKNTCSQIIKVTDDEKPKITCAADQSQTADAGVCKAAVTVTAPATSDNCAVASVTNDYNNTSDASGTYPVGSTTVTWTVTDIHGNKNTCSQIIKVTDDEKPKITCASDQSQTADAGVCKAVVTVTAPATSDNCAVASVTNDYNNTSDASGTYPVGSTTVTWTVTDIHGNKNTCSQIIKVTDDEKPAIKCKNYTLNLSSGTGTISAADIDNGTNDNCGIASMVVSPATFNCSNEGNNSVTLKATDIHGNISTCNATVLVQYQPSCSISVKPSDTTYTGGINTNLYLGYGAQSTKMTANVSGGSGFSYSWSPSTGLSCAKCQSPVFTPSAQGNYTFTVTVTNSNGCNTTSSVTFCVKDIRVSGKGGSGKVYLCHVPSGNCSNPQSLSISVNAVSSHLTNHSGDRLGKCGESCTSNKRNNVDSEIHDLGNLEVICQPNPFSGSFILSFESVLNTPISIAIYGMTGNLVEQVNTSGFTGEVELGKNLANGIYLVTFYQGTEKKIIRVVKTDY